MNNTVVHYDHTVLAKHALGSAPMGLTQTLDSKLNSKTTTVIIPTVITLFAREIMQHVIYVCIQTLHH